MSMAIVKKVEGMQNVHAQAIVAIVNRHAPGRPRTEAVAIALEQIAHASAYEHTAQTLAQVGELLDRMRNEARITGAHVGREVAAALASETTRAPAVGSQAEMWQALANLHWHYKAEAEALAEAARGARQTAREVAAVAALDGILAALAKILWPAAPAAPARSRRRGRK